MRKILTVILATTLVLSIFAVHAGMISPPTYIELEQDLSAEELAEILSELAESGFAQEEITVTLNGVELEFDTPPLIIGNRTMVPMRVIFEAFGFEVEWFEESQDIQATMRSDANDLGFGWGTLVELRIDNTEMRVSGGPVTVDDRPPPLIPWSTHMIITLDVPPMIVDNHTLVPLRAIMIGLNSGVEWDDDTRTIAITRLW